MPAAGLALVSGQCQRPAKKNALALSLGECYINRIRRSGFRSDGDSRASRWPRPAGFACKKTVNPSPLGALIRGMKAIFSHRATSRGRRLTAGIGLFIVGLALLPPFVSEGARVVIMDAFSAVCHQLPARSPHVNGIQLAACDRCMGIYFGIPLAAVLFTALWNTLGPVRERAPRVLLASLVPMGLDWGLDVLGFVTNTPSSRWMTGLLFGLAAGTYLVVASAEALRGHTAPN